MQVLYLIEASLKHDLLYPKDIFTEIEITKSVLRGCEAQVSFCLILNCAEDRSLLSSPDIKASSTLWLKDSECFEDHQFRIRNKMQT